MRDPNDRGEGQPVDAGPPQLPALITADERFKQLDRNSDKSISREEARGSLWLIEVFDRYDADKDGLLDATEFATYFGPNPSTRAGTPGDGRVFEVVQINGFKALEVARFVQQLANLTEREHQEPPQTTPVVPAPYALVVERPDDNLRFFGNDELGVLVIRARTQEDIDLVKRVMALSLSTLGGSKPRQSFAPTLPSLPATGGVFNQPNRTVVEYREKGNGAVIHRSFLPK